ncbi:hypothetical protein QUF63_16505 [Anaerolineales bacterium HSG25]|nr:hypothetical protein [Anaerolineales bacterium HSG25]
MTTNDNPLSKIKRFWFVPVILIALLLLGWFVSVQYETARTLTYTIPAGTSAGALEVEFPTEITMTLGVKDILVIDNQDDVLHSFGPFVIAANSTLRQRFSRPLTFEGTCTFHPDQAMTLVVHPAPWYVFW